MTWYQQNAELFFETWRDNIPEAAIHAFITAVKRHVKGKQAHILDVGCGPGHHSNFLSKFNFIVTGIDITPNVICIANKNRLNNTKFITGDMRSINYLFKYQRNIFDGIWAAGSLIHINSEVLRLQLYQFIAILKPGGILGATFQIGFDSEITNDGRFFERYKNERIVKKLLEDVGFSVLNHIIDYDGGSTTKKKIKVWCCFIAQSSFVKQVLYSNPSQ